MLARAMLIRSRLVQICADMIETGNAHNKPGVRFMFVMLHILLECPSELRANTSILHTAILFQHRRTYSQKTNGL
jgi:hypothetical protein